MENTTNFTALQSISNDRVINTPSPAAKSAFFYVQETGHLKNTAAHFTQREALDSYLFVAVQKGKGCLYYDGENYSLKKGDCFFIDCTLPHTYGCWTDEPWELLWVHFNGATTREYYRLFTQSFRYGFTPTNFDTISRDLQRIIEINENKDLYAEICSSRELVVLMTDVLTSGREGQEENAENISEKLLQAKAYLDEHFTEAVYLDDIADRFFISKYHLSREFKRVFGLNFSAYIINKRIEYAKYLLRFTDKSIEEIAGECGIGDASYFNKLFKKSENTTASKYRSGWKN